jgi:hypothetical protein
VSHTRGRTQVEGQNKVLRRTYGPKREDMAGDWRRLHNEELHNLYASPNIVSIIISGRLKWVRHAGCMGVMRNAYKTFYQKT